MEEKKVEAQGNTPEGRNPYRYLLTASGAGKGVGWESSNVSFSTNTNNISFATSNPSVTGMASSFAPTGVCPSLEWDGVWFRDRSECSPAYIKKLQQERAEAQQEQKDRLFSLSNYIFAAPSSVDKKPRAPK